MSAGGRRGAAARPSGAGADGRRPRRWRRPRGGGELSAYELERLANIKPNEAVLVALGLLDRSPSKEEEEEERAARQEARGRAVRKRVGTRSAAPPRKSSRLVAQADGAASRAVC